jgi:CPA1 family monovalent cation:H+ antiporter
MSFWSLTTFLLNGALFVLVGMQLPAVVAGLSSAALGTAVLVTVTVYVTVLLARFGFTTAMIFLIRAIDRRPQQRQLRTTARGRIVSTTAGFRGAISLAVALAVPTTLQGGVDSAARDMVVFVTAGVVVASLVVQGLALPEVIRWARLREDTSIDEELRLAKRTSTQAALDRLPDIAAELGVDDDIVDGVRAEYEEHLAVTMVEEEDGDTADSARRHGQSHDLRLALITVKREAVVRLRDDRIIDDTVLRQIQARLDIEEVRLAGQPQIE